VSDLLSFLQSLGADKIPHSGRTLLQHLEGTEAIVRRWGGNETVCRAALFHSIYGTEFFKNAPLKPSLETRRKIRKLIGPAAETLVFIFCTFQRSSIYAAIEANEEGEPCRLSKAQIINLVMILWANALEQGASNNRPRDRAFVVQCAEFLPPVALRELLAYTANIASLLNVRHRRVGKFLEGWPDKNFVTHGSVSRLGGLVDFSFDELVALPRRYTRAFTPKGEHIRIGQGQEREHYDAGNTIYWHSLRSPTIDAWVQALDQDLGLVPGATRVSGFASKRGAGVPTHYDPNDNFTCQGRGTKTWRVASERNVRYPTEGATMGMAPSRIVLREAGEGMPREMPKHDVIEMTPGDVMFTPRGVWHDTKTTSDESIHFNVQCGLATWKDAVDFVLSTSTKLHTHVLCAPILRTPNFKIEVQKRVREVGNAIASGELEFDAEAFRKFVMRRKEA
jgi:hypothetical protein